jgi:hypothetical protein
MAAVRLVIASAAKQYSLVGWTLDCFVALLLAMTTTHGGPVKLQENTGVRALSH